MTAVETTEPTTTTSIELPANYLARAFKIAHLAAANDPGRPILCGVLVEWDGIVLKLTTTDSYRMFRQTLKPYGLEGPARTPFKAIIPSHWLYRWAKPKRHGKTMATLSIADGWATLTCGDERSSVRNIATPDQYPDVDGMIERMGKSFDDGQGAFNPRYLADVFKAADMFGSDGHPIRVIALSKLKPSIFQVTREGDVLDLLLMPVRVG